MASGEGRAAARLPVAATVLAAAAGISSGAGPSFVDQTAKVGLTATHVADQDFIGLEYWQSGGMALGDFDRDGSTDVFWLSGGAGPDKLFINDGTGVFTDQALAWGLTALHCGIGASAADYDGDGWIDIFVTSWGDPTGKPGPGHHRLYHNEGGKGFVNVAETAGVAYSSAFIGGGYGSAWGDYDLDGDLDLFIAHWHIVADGNRLYRNNGDGTFTDVTAAAIGPMNTVWGFQPVFADMDGDHWPELLVSADFESSRYFVNQGDGTFVDHTADGGLGLDDNGMGNTVGDVNNDGRLDWYVTSIHKDFPQPGDNVGNMLYVASADHTFLELSVPTGCNDGGWGWGTQSTDLDNDGWLDLVEVNGRPGAPEWTNEAAKLFHNVSALHGGILTFLESGAVSGFVHEDQGTALATFDADEDGDEDILSFANNGALRYFENETDLGNSWLRIGFDTSANALLAPDGFGTRVEVTAGGTTRVRYADGRPSYLATGEHVLHFGLGQAAVADEVRIEWARGQTTVLTGVAVNQRLLVVAPALGDLNGDGAIGFADLLQLIGAWDDCGGAGNPCPADLDADNDVDFGDLLIMLGHWSP